MAAPLARQRGRSGGPARGHRWFAACYDPLMCWAERWLLRPIRQRVAGEARGRVLEVGAGTGANFPYYSPGVDRVVATEPDPFMLRRAIPRARAARAPMSLCRAAAEALPFREGSFDTVVVTLVLCSVSDQAQGLAEARRVLRPGGSLRFLEHVRGEGRLGRLQDLLTPLWSRLGAGCRPNRRTEEAIRAAGFRLQEVEHRPGSLTPLIIGAAETPA